MCLLGSVFGLWSMLELFVTANIDVKTFWFKSMLTSLVFIQKFKFIVMKMHKNCCH